MKIENLFVTWQQRSAQSNMPISVSAAQAGGRLGLLTAHWEHQLAYGKGEHWSSEQGACQGWCLAVEQCSPLELLGLLGSSTRLGKEPRFPALERL